MKRILVISWFYPPINSSEGLVTFKLLNNSRYEYDVFTQKNATDFSYGKNVALENHPNVRSVYAKSSTVAEWKEEAVRYFKEHRGEYDCIMTRSMPQESHEVGTAIKKEFPDVYWIASFGDPIKSNPYQHIDGYLHPFNGMDNLLNRNKGIRYRLSPRRILSTGLWRIRYRDAVKFRSYLAKLEDDALKYCDCVIFNNESEQKYMSTSDKILKKSVVLPHTYDVTFYPERDPEPHDKIRFLFVGHLDDIRTVRPLFEAIKDLKDSDGSFADRVRFDFYGDMSDGDLAFWARNGLGDAVILHRNVPYLESLELMRNADWNIHIDGNISSVCDENVFFAAKVADYFGSGTPIFSYTMPNGATYEYLKNAGELILSYSAMEIRQYLYSIIYKGLTVTPNEEYISEKFDAVNVAKRFDDEVIKPFLERK